MLPLLWGGFCDKLLRAQVGLFFDLGFFCISAIMRALRVGRRGVIVKLEKSQ
ncbi:hypothetical protein MNBD_GAMMA18-1777 [hydrothermal vent metagenome]|uniref:Uncharacterized protein n=1 Tax=hydrothermal vent metagenome TaxID=652676 RepID=A0A3B0ZZU3_9ZZZZ